jgi:hypothetical protein
MTHMTLALFDEFDAAEVAAIESAIQADKLADGQARAMRRQGRIHARRLLAEQHLAEILPATLDEGESLHVISHGDVDSLTYLRYVLTFGPADHVLLSTWCMARPDIEELREHLAASRIRTPASTATNSPWSSKSLTSMADAAASRRIIPRSWRSRRLATT